MSGKNFSFVIVAGGKGSRMGGEKKQFMNLSGRPLWKWSAENASSLGISEIVLVIPAGEKINPDWDNTTPIKITHGGSERAISVLNGLNAATGDYVLVHDAARPFASKKLLRSLMDAVSDDVGAVPVLPVADALKKIDGENISCVNRDGLFITQTPQVFHREKLIAAVRENPYAKDEAEAWKNSGLELRAVDGERMNFKITWPEDFEMARAITHATTRTGLGYDVHRLVPERKLILGGVLIENSVLGLLGHSDADILTHSIMDAILGAAGLDDIGTIFPASDEKFKGADSMKLLQEVLRLVKNSGWDVEFVDAVIQAQVPKLNHHKDAIRKSLGKFFPINVKFKSAENLDDAGRGLCMSCWACATLGRREKNVDVLS